MLEIFFGIALLAVAIYIAIKVLGNMTIGLILILLVLFASYLILGGFPDLEKIPIIGRFLPEIPKTTGEAIATIKSAFYDIEVLSLSRDSDNNLLITVANTGKMKVSNFAVVIDNNQVKILNKPRDPLESGSVTTIETDWKEGFKRIIVQTDQTNILFTLD